MDLIIAFARNVVTDQGYVLAAYFAVLASFQFRYRKSALHMARVARHAVWAAALVITVHSFSLEVSSLMLHGSPFADVVHVLVTVLIGALLYQLGCLFEADEAQAVPVRSEP